MMRFWGFIVVLAFVQAAAPVQSRASDAEIRDAYERGRTKEAAEAAWNLLQLRRADSGPRSLEAAQAVELLCDVLPTHADSPTDSLLSWLEEAQATRERQFGADDPEVLPAIWRRCSILRRMRQFDPVMELLARARGIVDANQDLPDRYRMEVLVADGDLAYARRDVDTAMSLHQAAFRIAESMEQPPAGHVARVTLRLAYDRAESGDVVQSLELTERSLRMFEALYGPDAGSLVSALNHRATLLGRLGRPTEAIADNERATLICRRTLGEDHPFVAGMLNNLGNLLSKVGDYRRAGAAYEESIRLRVDVYGPDHPLLAQSYMNYGRCLSRLAKFEPTMEAYEHSLAILRAHPGSDGQLLIKLLTNLGATYNYLARYDDSRRVLEEAIDLIETSLGPTHLSLATPLVNLSVLERFQGHLELSLAAAERSLRIQMENYGEANASLIEGYDSVAITKFLMGDAGEAIRGTLRAERFSREELQSTARGFSESTANSAARDRDSRIPAVLRFATKLDPSQTELMELVAEEAFRSRGLVLEQAMRRRRRLLGRADDTTRAVIQEMEAARSDLLTHLAKRPAPTEQESYVERLEELRDRVDATEDDFARVDFVEAEANREIHLSQLREALPAHGALVSYWYAPPALSYQDKTGRYFAVVTRKNTVELFDLGDAVRIDRDIDLWREGLESLPTPGDETADRALSDRMLFDRGKRVREQLWDPLRPALGEVDLVLIVPDDRLHFVSFAALPHDDGVYMVERGPTLHLLSSERDLLAGRKFDGGSTGGLLVLGGADFDAASEGVGESSRALPSNLRSISDCVSFRSLQFEPLPATEEEASSIAQLWREKFTAPPLVLSGGGATEEVVRAEAPRYSTLHFATHGFFLGGECEESSPRLRGVGGLAPSWSSADAVDESFRLSGLALAGANERESRGQGSADGILTAEEIATLDLRGVRWAVLSACDTGLGDLVRAEGVLGLRRSFRLAGAATVISSLWAVEDEATQAWMKELYRARLEDGLDTASAVREASRRVLAMRRASGQSTHPFYWASFSGSGRWE